MICDTVWTNDKVSERLMNMMKYSDLSDMERGIGTKVLFQLRLIADAFVQIQLFGCAIDVYSQGRHIFYHKYKHDKLH